MLAAMGGDTSRSGAGPRLLLAGAIVAAGLAGCSAQAGGAPPPARPSVRPAAGPHVSSVPTLQPAAQPSQSAPGQSAPDQAVPAFLEVASAPRRVAARGAALADLANRQLLWSRDLDTELPMGSITKVMTALIVVQSGDLSREIRIPKSVLNYVAKYQAESAGLHPGDIVTAQDLLEAMLLPSGCDAAYVLALTYGPGMPAFLAKMNATAQELGMTHTHFTSPDGLPYPTEHSTYSTPRDLVTLGMAAMLSPVIRSIVRQSFFHLRKGPHHHSYWWDNTNDLIGSYPGADGIKTGYTDAAKHCLLFEATRGGRTLIGVVLGSPVTGPDEGAIAAARLLNWGFGLKPQSAGQAAATG
jgi:D-alanyl-D-alanine carboxypeptidase (penicillin-binding protein 5/6)